ncbi:MAG: SRPBCC domain-containing protein [Acidimicrobiales bacterium]
MADIRHRVGIAALPEEIYEKLATIDGLASWWTRDVTGDAGVGGTLEFSFGGGHRIAGMQVVDLQPARRVGWRGVKGPDEWLDTTFTFDLAPATEETVLLFTNAGWREPVEFIHHCTTKWAYYILGLKASLEGGKARPYPDDMHISSWD